MLGSARWFVMPTTSLLVDTTCTYGPNRSRFAPTAPPATASLIIVAIELQLLATVVPKAPGMGTRDMSILPLLHTFSCHTKLLVAPCLMSDPALGAAVPAARLNVVLEV